MRRSESLGAPGVTSKRKSLCLSVSREHTSRLKTFFRLRGDALKADSVAFLPLKADTAFFSSRTHANVLFSKAAALNKECALIAFGRRWTALIDYHMPGNVNMFPPPSCRILLLYGLSFR